MLGLLDRLSKGGHAGSMTQTQDHARDQAEQSPDLSQWHTETREVTWALPGQGNFEALAAMDGLGQLQAIEQGLMPPPPVMATVDMCGFQAERGSVTVRMTRNPSTTTPSAACMAG